MDELSWGTKGSTEDEGEGDAKKKIRSQRNVFI